MGLMITSLDILLRVASSNFPDDRLGVCAPYALAVLRRYILSRVLSAVVRKSSASRWERDYQTVLHFSGQCCYSLFSLAKNQTKLLFQTAVIFGSIQAGNVSWTCTAAS